MSNSCGIHFKPMGGHGPSNSVNFFVHLTKPGTWPALFNMKRSDHTTNSPIKQKTKNRKGLFRLVERDGWGERIVHSVSIVQYVLCSVQVTSMSCMYKSSREFQRNDVISPHGWYMEFISCDFLLSEGFDAWLRTLVILAETSMLT